MTRSGEQDKEKPNSREESMDQKKGRRGEMHSQKSLY